MNPALPLSLLFAATVSAAAWSVWRRRPAGSAFNTYHQARPSVTTSEPGDGASRSKFRTGARASLGVPPSAETNFAAKPRRLGGLFWRSLQNTNNVVHGARLTASADEQPLQSRPREFCRVEKMASRLAHNQEVAGSSPAPATNSGISVEGQQPLRGASEQRDKANATTPRERRAETFPDSLPHHGLVATPRRARRLSPLPAWALLVSTLNH